MMQLVMNFEKGIGREIDRAKRSPALVDESLKGASVHAVESICEETFYQRLILLRLVS